MARHVDHHHGQMHRCGATEHAAPQPHLQPVRGSVRVSQPWCRRSGVRSRVPALTLQPVSAGLAFATFSGVSVLVSPMRTACRPSGACAAEGTPTHVGCSSVVPLPGLQCLVLMRAPRHWPGLTSAHQHHTCSHPSCVDTSQSLTSRGLLRFLVTATRTPSSHPPQPSRT